MGLSPGIKGYISNNKLDKIAIEGKTKPYWAYPQVVKDTHINLDKIK